MSRWNALSCSISQWSWGVSWGFSSPGLSTGPALEAFGGRGGEGSWGHRLSSERTSRGEGHSSEEKKAGLSHRLPLVWPSHSYR